MLFKAPFPTAIAGGQVTLAFRRWRKPTGRTGRTLTTPVGVPAIDAVEIVSPDAIDEGQAQRAGYACLQAVRLGRETLTFKADVRKLKALGLTESLEDGYRLSARGEALLAARRSGG